MVAVELEELGEEGENECEGYLQCWLVGVDGDTRAMTYQIKQQRNEQHLEHSLSQRWRYWSCICSHLE